VGGQGRGEHSNSKLRGLLPECVNYALISENTISSNDVSIILPLLFYASDSIISVFMQIILHGAIKTTTRNNL
jgi:hypothetical protein